MKKMKTILFSLVILCIIISCKNEEPARDYAVISGTVANPIKNRKLKLYDYENQKSVLINVDENGDFRDTLKLDHPTFYNASYSSVFPIYVKNGMELNLKFKDSGAAPVVTGEGSNSYEFLEKKNKLMGNTLKDYKSFIGQPKNDFEADMKQYNEDFNDLLASNEEGLDSTFINRQKKDLNTFNESMDSEFTRYKEINDKLAKGNPSPDFQDYINYDGGKTSLADLKGQYAYIDVWATWCGPCKYEIPYLKKIEEEYKGKNIQFVSISIDRLKDEEKWRDMIKDKEIGGTQLLADNEIESQFVQDYFIQGIPRYIILDPEGKIVDYDAPRPSEEKLKTVFNSLDI